MISEIGVHQRSEIISHQSEIVPAVYASIRVFGEIILCGFADSPIRRFVESYCSAVDEFYPHTQIHE